MVVGRVLEFCLFFLFFCCCFVVVWFFFCCFLFFCLLFFVCFLLLLFFLFFFSCGLHQWASVNKNWKDILEYRSQSRQPTPFDTAPEAIIRHLTWTFIQSTNDSQTKLSTKWLKPTNDYKKHKTLLYSRLLTLQTD